MSGTAEGKRPAPVEPEEGGGAAKRQKQRRDGGVAEKPGNGAHKEEHTSQNKRDGEKSKVESGGVASKQRSKCPHQRRRSECKECRTEADESMPDGLEELCRV